MTTHEQKQRERNIAQQRAFKRSILQRALDCSPVSVDDFDTDTRDDELELQCSYRDSAQRVQHFD